MEICKAPTLQLKALDKHNTHNVYRDGKRYIKKEEDIDTVSCRTMQNLHTHTHTRTHTLTHRTD